MICFLVTGKFGDLKSNIAFKEVFHCSREERELDLNP